MPERLDLIRSGCVDKYCDSSESSDDNTQTL